MVYIKYMPYHSAVGASRNKREISAAREYGFETMFFSNDNSKEHLGLYDDTALVNDGTIILNRNIPSIKRKLLIIKNILSVHRETRKLPVGIWSCHDLSSLKTAWISTLFCRKKPVFVYDSHEFELGRNAKRSKIKVLYIKWWERFLIKKCAFSIMVNDSIADEVQKIYKLKERPIVVRSTPDFWDVNNEVCKEIREKFYSEFENRGIENKPFLLMYHGGITNLRGIETLLQITALNPNVCSIILGNGDETYLKTLYVLIRQLGISDRVLFREAVSINELWKYVGAVDVGMILINGTMKNHIFSLPNKFFENIQSMTPIISTNFPEMKRLIDKYEIGLTCNSSDVNAVNECVEKMRTDSELYSKYKENLKTAKSELCWENEKKVLLNAFSEYLITNK